jgi:hypothetical protein
MNSFSRRMTVRTLESKLSVPVRMLRGMVRCSCGGLGPLRRRCCDVHWTDSAWSNSAETGQMAVSSWAMSKYGLLATGTWLRRDAVSTTASYESWMSGVSPTT